MTEVADAFGVSRQRCTGETVTVASIGNSFHVYDGDLLLVQVANTTTKPDSRFNARKPERARTRTKV